MTINDKIKGALSPFGLPAEQGVYDGEEKTYFVYNYTLLPRQFVDNKPLFYRVLIQVHLFAPYRFDSAQLRADVPQRLSEAGFDWPETVDVSDESQHYVFETGMVESVRNIRKE